jgi:hypothetical protein
MEDERMLEIEGFSHDELLRRARVFREIGGQPHQTVGMRNTMEQFATACEDAAKRKSPITTREALAAIAAARALLAKTDALDASRSRIATHHEREALRRALAELDNSASEQRGPK